VPGLRGGKFRKYEITVPGKDKQITTSHGTEVYSSAVIKKSPRRRKGARKAGRFQVEKLEKRLEGRFF